MTDDSPVPTQQDFDNAATRALIAEKQQLEYAECLRLAMGAFGPGWVPSHRHMLIEKSEEARVRYTSERAKVAATVYTVKNAEGEKRHFTVVDGQVVCHESMEAGFGSMLLEPDTRTIEVRGQQVHPHRYSLCFAPFVLYEPKSASDLARLRQNRERGKKQREQEKWEQDNPLLVWIDKVKLEQTSPEDQIPER